MRKKILIKSKKAEGGLVEIILLVLLALASIVILWKISYFMILEGSESPEKTICITTEFNIKKINDLTFNIKRIFGNKEFNTVEFIINTDETNIDSSTYTVPQNNLQNQMGTAQIVFTHSTKPQESIEIALVLDENKCEKSQKICFDATTTGYGRKCN